MKNTFQYLIAQRQHDVKSGIASFCTANEIVIEACLEQAFRFQGEVLIEATANQVNQYGGYTGMRPADFRDFVYSIAERADFPKNKIILGGDHLGPLVWSDLPEKEAMKRAKELVRLFVSAGYRKIHLDTSMRLASDSADLPLSHEVVARRGVALYRECQEAYKELLRKDPAAQQPVYVIGSEVPIPGGIHSRKDAISVTKPEELCKTISSYRQAFNAEGLSDAFDNIIGIVVQPGVEFGNDTVFRYNRCAAQELVKAAKKFPSIVLEGHSTDYQPAPLLREMVEDGVAILKVGPALTFSLRAGLFALSFIEKELIAEERQSHLIETLERLMLENPLKWKHYYHGAGLKLQEQLKYSYSDRCRYYFPENDFSDAVEKLFKNLEEVRIPMSMLNQYLPNQYRKIQNGKTFLKPRDLVKDRIVDLIDDYNYAVSPWTTCR